MIKIFISWSGKKSGAIAKALNDWLPKVIQEVDPFYSSEIEKGTKGIDVIQSLLEETSFGIICLTRDNLESKWIHFESGALAKLHNSGAGRVWTLLYDVSYSDVTQPLAQFQHTSINKDEILRLLESINKHVARPLPPQMLNSVFNKWWLEFEEELKKVADLSGETLATVDKRKGSIRTEREVLDEILGLLRDHRDDLAKSHYMQDKIMMDLRNQSEEHRHSMYLMNDLNKSNIEELREAIDSLNLPSSKNKPGSRW
jgi:hypothetical protein